MSLILWVEGQKGEGQPFIAALRKKGYQVEVVSTGAEAANRIGLQHPDLVVINSASLRSSGKRICSNLRKKSTRLPIMVIVTDDLSTANDEHATVTIRLPFTPRKLLNWITPLMPWNEGNILQS